MSCRSLILALVVPLSAYAQTKPVLDTTRYQRTAPELRGLRWRLVGPFRGGRAVAVTGDPSNPRIFYFGGGDTGEHQYLTGSADMMPRNLDRRVEAVVPVTDPDLQARLEEILAVNLADDMLAWELASDATWRKVPTSIGISAQRRFQELAVERARRRREPESLRV